MKKIFLFGLVSLILLVGCKKSSNLLPDETIIESNIDKINMTKNNIAKETFLNIKKTADLYYLELQIVNGSVDNEIIIDFADDTTIPESFVFGGIMPSSGIVIISDDGSVTLEDIVVNNFCCNFNEQNIVVCE